VGTIVTAANEATAVCQRISQERTLADELTVDAGEEPLEQPAPLGQHGVGMPCLGYTLAAHRKMGRYRAR
jgi:hypothetical protein